MLWNSGTTAKFLPDTSYVCVYFNVDHTMICKREDLSHNAIVNWRIWRRNCLAWCVKTLKSNQFWKTSQEKSRSNRGADTASDARKGPLSLMWGFATQMLTPIEIRIQIIYSGNTKQRKKRQYVSRVLKVEQATFTPLVFGMTGRMAVECKWYHSRLDELIATMQRAKAVRLPCHGSGVNCHLPC